MWELVGFAAGMAVLMVIFAFLSHIYELPELLGKFVPGSAALK
jgi:hypothetical protein